MNHPQGDGLPPSPPMPVPAAITPAPPPTSGLVVALRVLFTLATIGTILFIFANSAEIGAISGGKSALVTEFLNKGFTKLGLGFRISEHLVRKLAHFAEYALLGFWLMLTLRVYTRRVISFVSWPLFLGLLVPVCDEFFQTFVPGRAGAVRDVVIDFCGVCAGLVCGMFLLLLVRMWTVLRKSKERL